MIKVYDDIEQITAFAISNEECVEERITSTTLKRLAYDYLSIGHRDAILWHATAFNQEKVEVLFLPKHSRAGVVHGGVGDWTNASSPQDALERYFGVDGKEMCE